MKLRINKNTVSEERKEGGLYCLPGINNHPAFPELKNVQLFAKSFEYKKEEEDNEYFEITMVDSEERTVRRRYFNPMNSRYDKEKETDKFSSVMANFARKFKGLDYEIILSGEITPEKEFEVFCKKVIADIGDSYKGIALRTKVILNRDDFPTLPGYAPIWERLDTVPPEKSVLEIKAEFKDRVVVKEVTPDTTIEEPSWANS